MEQYEEITQEYADEHGLKGLAEKVDGEWWRYNEDRGVQWLDRTMNDLVHRFEFHPADTDLRALAHEQVRTVMLMAAERMARSLPPGRELSLVITKLEEAMFWGNAAVARAYDAKEDS